MNINYIIKARAVILYLFNNFKMNLMTNDEKIEKFIWLAHGETKKFKVIAEELGVTEKQLSQWERDKDIRIRWLKVAEIRKIFISKKIKANFKEFYDWYLELEKEKKCFYCDITEEKLNDLFRKLEGKGEILTKRGRGRKLELDRKDPNPDYNNTKNIVFACYWCNNAKTDTFTHEEFIEVGKVLNEIWKKRLSE